MRKLYRVFGFAPTMQRISRYDGSVLRLDSYREVTDVYFESLDSAIVFADVVLSDWPWYIYLVDNCVARSSLNEV